jgi:hypothetical protein
VKVVKRCSVLIAVAALRFLYKISQKGLDLRGCHSGTEEADPVVPGRAVEGSAGTDRVGAPIRPQKLPVVLSPEEVLQFLDCVAGTKASSGVAVIKFRREGSSEGCWRSSCARAAATNAVGQLPGECSRRLITVPPPGPLLNPRHSSRSVRLKRRRLPARASCRTMRSRRFDRAAGVPVR